MGELIDAEDVFREDLRDPAFRARWEACAVGRALAIWLIRYRLDHNIEFDDLAARLGLDFDGMADLEDGETDPPYVTLAWLSQTLDTPIELCVERGVPGEGGTRLLIDATAAKAA